MSESTLLSALAGIAAIPQFFIYRLEWNSADGKYDKTPCANDGSVYKIDASLPENWQSFDSATHALRLLDVEGAAVRYSLGFYFTHNLGYWFLDVDHCFVDGVWSVWANWFTEHLGNVFCEVSSSGTGLHFIGRGQLPLNHRTRPTKDWKLSNPGNDFELYSGGRGVAFGLTGRARGSADAESAVLIETVQPAVFPVELPGLQSNNVLANDGPREDWRGPTDDNELLRRAMASKSVASKLGGKAAFSDLWLRNVDRLAASYPSVDDAPYGESEADLALAAHLAFWTGCDADRMERLMRQSALARPKWDEHKTYLRKLTIGNACNKQKEVCQDKEMVPAADSSLSISTEDWIARVTAATEEELREVVIPAIAADRSVELLDRDRLALLVKERLAVFQIPTSIAQCRAMLRLVAVEDDSNVDALPTFASEHVYVSNNDCFFHLPTACSKSRTAFNAEYNRYMPYRQNGDREDAAKWALERWAIPIVRDVMYRPDQMQTFRVGNATFANSFAADSSPVTATTYSEVGVAGINAFLKHLHCFTNGRKFVLEHLLSWIAHNVQFPGRKIRHAPLLKGVDGDGKSIMTNVIRAAMGMRNVSSVGPSIIANSGGFTDWQGGKAVVGIEEIMLTGRRRYEIYNMLKEPISNDYITLNRKGNTQLDIRNVTNYIAYTNHSDAIPLTDTDRRWMIIFSPYASAAALAITLELKGIGELSGFFNLIWHSLDACGGEWRKYFLDYPISANFDANAHAPMTDEKSTMIASGEDEHTSIARQIIGCGAYGVHSDVLSSAALTLAMRATCIADGLEAPKTSTLNHMLSRMGYAAIGSLWWDGKTHRCWIPAGVRKPTTDEIRILLESTKTLHDYKDGQLVMPLVMDITH